MVLPIIATRVPAHMPKIDPVIRVKGDPGRPSGAAMDWIAIKIPATIKGFVLLMFSNCANVSSSSARYKKAEIEQNIIAQKRIIFLNIVYFVSISLYDNTLSWPVLATEVLFSACLAQSVLDSFSYVA